MSYTLFKLLSTGCLQDELLDSNLFIIIGKFMGNNSALYKDVFIKNEWRFNLFEAILKLYPGYKWVFNVLNEDHQKNEEDDEEKYEILGVGINEDGNYKIIDRPDEGNPHECGKFWIDFLKTCAEDVIDPIKYISYKGDYYDDFCDRIKGMKYSEMKRIDIEEC